MCETRVEGRLGLWLDRVPGRRRVVLCQCSSLVHLRYYQPLESIAKRQDLWVVEEPSTQRLSRMQGREVVD